MIELPEDSRSDLNPYLIGHYIYGVIAPYFIEHYNLQYHESYPKDKVESPAITWRVYRRTPGGGKHGLAKAKGESYSRTDSVDEFGQVTESHKQEQMVVLEFAVFGTASDEVDQIAWDLENAIKDSEGVLQRTIEGFSLAFSEQVGASGMSWRIQDDLNVRTLRFTILFPVRYKVIVTQLREIIFKGMAGSISTRKAFTRTSSDKLFTIPTDDSTVVTSIAGISKQPSGSAAVYELYAGVDYQITESSVDGSLKIRWLDTQGAPPNVGDMFVVDYCYSKVVDYKNMRHSVSTLAPAVVVDSAGNDLTERIQI